MDIPRCEAMFKYWTKAPPVHLSMAAYVGWGQSKKQSADNGDLDGLLASLPTKEFNQDGSGR
jgi:hypothetical protein